ncbi:MAG: ABC transporter substrate-binding protein [Thermomicrobiales bacterium]
MDQHEVLAILTAKLRSGVITRRQFLQAASFFGLGAAAVPMGTAAAPGSRTRGPRSMAQQEGAVRFLVAEAFWANWHPYLHTAQIQRRIEQQIFDPLVRNETTDFSTFSPGLAESWEPVDELTWQFTLRQGVTFHNGQPFTGADVKASVELASGATAEEVSTASVLVPTTVEVVDDFTIRLTTATPFAPLLIQLATLPILSADDIKPSADAATPSAGIEALKAAPNGTGPFRLATDEGDVKTMEANAGYWGGAPQIQTLIWEYIQDSQTRLNALLAGQAQAIDRVPPEHIPTLEGSDEIALISTTGFENVNLWIRQDAPPPWDNPKLREAVAWSIDREALVNSLVLGASEVSTTHIPNHALYAAPQEPVYTFDPERAQAALAEAGLDAFPEVPLWGVTGFLPRGQQVAEAIADSLQQVGFTVSLQVTDVAAIIDALFSEDKPGLMFHLSWSSNGDPHAALATLYHSPGAWSGAHDPTIDELIDTGAATTDPDARAQVYAELQGYLWQNLPHIPLYNSDFTIAHQTALTGVTALPNFMTFFDKASLGA